jgi:hypothetical protein
MCDFTLNLFSVKHNQSVSQSTSQSEFDGKSGAYFTASIAVFYFDSFCIFIFRTGKDAGAGPVSMLYELIFMKLLHMSLFIAPCC